MHRLLQQIWQLFKRFILKKCKLYKVQLIDFGVVVGKNWNYIRRLKWELGFMYNPGGSFSIFHLMIILTGETNVSVSLICLKISVHVPKNSENGLDRPQ